MTLTTLDPTVALIVVDLQQAIVATPCAHPMDAVIARAAELCRAFRAHGRPVVLVNVDARAPGRTEAAGGAPGSTAPFPPEAIAIVPELEAQDSDLRVTKRTWGAFHGTGLHERLVAAGVTQVVVVGVATSAGVESTAREAYAHGYDVTLAVDAMTDRSAEAHANSVERVFPRLGETGTAAEVIARLG